MSENTPPAGTPPPPTTTTTASPKKKAEAPSKTSSCEHVTEGGGPCSVCDPRKSWVADGRMPDSWKHVPWDILELKKHRVPIMEKQNSSGSDREELDERPDPSIQEELKRSMRAGELEGSVVIEQWPRVKVTSDDQVPPPEIPSFGSTTRSVDEESERRRRAPKPERRAAPRQRTRKIRSKSSAGGLQVQKFVFPMKRVGKRSRSVDVAFAVQVSVPGGRRRRIRIRRRAKSKKQTQRVKE